MPVINKLFNRLFPPPKFLKMPAVGLDISDESIHFIELEEFKKGLIIKSFGEREISRDIIKSGYIKDAKKIVEILLSLKKEFTSGFVNVSLPEQHAYLLKLRLPNMKRSEIRGSIELQLEDNIPISAADAIFDYDIIENGLTTSNETEVELSAFPKTNIENYLNIFKEVGLYPLSFEIEAQSIARSVIQNKDTRTFLIIDFGKTRTGLFIVSGGITRFASTIEIGGMSITRAIKNLLHIETKEAEEIKKTRGIVKEKEDEELFLIIMSIVAVLKEEVHKHYTYWHTHKDPYGGKRPEIEKIILCGGDANLKGLTEYLSSDLKIDVELANIMINVNSLDEYVPEINFKESLHYATAVGLALRHYA